jgi:hypothetical protein
MGPWGTAIFTDDFAADVRDEWREAILDGRSPEEATNRVVMQFGQAIEGDPDEVAVFWMALAAAQMETGRLQPRVRDRALAVIETGGDVERWAEENPGLARRREGVLERLAAKLRGPQPKPKRLRRPPVYDISFDIGDVVLVRNRGKGVEALFAVVEQSEGRGRYTHVEPLLWEGKEVPPAEELAAMPALVEEGFLPRRWPELSRAERDAARPLLTKVFTITTLDRAEAFGPHIGEVIAKNVDRDHPGRQPSEGFVLIHGSTWPELAEWIDEPDYRRAIELTRETSKP